MLARHTIIPNLRSVILAGGNGTRLSSSMVEQWLGYAMPKQYCTFTGSRSMLQHTFDRACQLSDPTRIMTVVTRGHEPYAERQIGSRGGRLVIQPSNRDTAAGVLLPLTYIRDCDPDATVVLYPADHFVFPEEAFVKAIRHATLAVEMFPGKVMLMGVRPDRSELEYGRIILSQEIGAYGPYRMWEVADFVEKPAGSLSRSLQNETALWNTLILVGKVETFWKFGWACLPSMMRQFELFQQSIGSDREEAVLDTLYRVMSVRNFSRDILEEVSDRLVAMELGGVAWNDWDKPERITQSLHQIGKIPAFSHSLVGAVAEHSRPVDVTDP
ncbi:sugar phosphate nucleotidyltransferase [Petrachloros mirabilis]